MVERKIIKKENKSCFQCHRSNACMLPNIKHSAVSCLLILTREKRFR